MSASDDAMDEERFETLILDELYGELDEETSAAMKRYAAANPRAAHQLAALDGVRRSARSAMVEPPSDLEARVLARARATKREASPAPGWLRVVSWAGSWAMKPQMAMAALFLLMIGSSVLLVRGRRAGEPPRSGLTVTEQGSPATESAEANEPFDAPDPKSAALAHGAERKKAAAVSGRESADPSGHENAEADEVFGGAPAGGLANGNNIGHGSALGGGAAGPRAETEEHHAKGGARKAEAADLFGEGAVAASPAPAAPPPSPRAPATLGAAEAEASPRAEPAADDKADRAASRGTGAAVTPQQSAPGRSVVKASGEPPLQGGYEAESAMAAYGARDYAGARARFDRLAAAGDPVAALWAARSAREGSGCAAAVARFDALSARYAGTPVGYDAALEGGHCHRLLGHTDLARARLTPLLSVPSHAARAQTELDALAAGAGGTARAAPAPAKPASKAESH